MKQAGKCPKCGGELAADAAEGLCPACLMKQAMATASKADATVLVEPTESQTLNPALGTKVRYFGDYELLNEIARGGMGVIYKARQASLNRTVALKMILSGQLATEEEVKRFRIEAEAAANLQHPNIVAIHEVGLHDGRHYFTMDYVEGSNLAQVADGKPMPAARAAAYVKTIAEAVHFAHQRGTLHRDLKPQNILIDSLDHVRITDFGLAKQVQRESGLTLSGVVMGSPSYMPPEQAQGRQDQVGPQSDVYSLGAILYELLTGRAPFRADTPMATLVKVIEEEPTAPSKLEPNVPRDLETICLKCLDKSPERRYASARALTEELDRFLKNEPILARPASALRKAVSWSRRHPLALVALAALLILGLACAVLFLAEQNAFLRALQANPGLKRVPGPLTRAMKDGWDAVGALGCGVGAFVWMIFSLRGRQATWSETFGENAWRTPPLGGPRWRTVLVCAGLVSIACAGALLVKGIQAHVWEGYSLWWGGCGTTIYLDAYFGLMLLWTAWTDLRRARRGIAPRELPADVTAAIRGALLDLDFRRAFQTYSQALPDADTDEARQYVMRVYADLRQREPATLAAAKRRLHPLDVNWRLMAVVAVVEIVFGLALWLMWPQAQVAQVLWRVAAGFVYGALLIVAVRLHGLVRWLTVLVFAPMAAVAVMLPGYLLMGPPNPPFREGRTWWAGVLCGVVMMVTGYTRSRARPRPGSTAAAAGAAAAAAQVSPVIAAAGSVAGAVAGPAIGIAGAYLGAKASIQNTKTARDRQFMARAAWGAMALAAMFCVAIWLVPRLCGDMARTHPGRFAAILTTLIVVYGVVLTACVLWTNRRQRQIQKEEDAIMEREREEWRKEQK